MGVSPDVSLGDLPGPIACPGGEQQPIALHDALDSTTVVPKSGKFVWNVNQSTRPFVGGGSVKDSVSGSPLRPGVSQDGDPSNQNPQDMPFTVKPEDANNVMRIELTAHLPAEDYDLYVYRVVNGQRVAVGSSAGSTGHEVVDLTRPEAGSYIAEVVPFTGVTQNWTVTATPFAILHEVTPTGNREVYEMSCEDAKGNVLSRQSIYVARGQTLAVKPRC